MADFSTLSAALEQKYREYIQSQINRATVSLDLANIQDGRGKNIAFDVTVGTDTSDEYTDGADVSSYKDDTEKPATQAWVLLSDPFKITGLIDAAAAFSDTDMENLFMRKLNQAGQRLASRVNQRYIGGSGAGSPAQMFGLTTSGGPLYDSGVYMGIDRSSFTQWQGNVLANSSVPRSVTLGLLDSAQDQAYDASGKVFDYWMTNTTQWRKIADLMRGDKDRFTKEVTIKGQEITLQGGQQAIVHNGVPILHDKDWTAGTIAGIRSESVGVEFLPPRVREGFGIGMIPIAGTPQEQAGTQGQSRGLMAKLIKLGFTGDAMKFQLVVYLNTWCNEPNAQALIVDLD